MAIPTFSPSKAILELGDEFYDPVRPADFPITTPRFLNRTQAERVGLGRLSEADWIRHFARFEPLGGSLPQPLALRYHGHQFRHYNKDLGDGRGFLFAQVRDERGRLLDFGTKGSGQTPWSRRGDGRLTLKGAMREALATEMLESLGVNTSKTFSFFETGEELVRGDEPSPTRSAVLTRLSHSHVRYGTFQRLAFFKKTEEITKLVEYCGRHFFPSILELEPAKRPGAFLAEVTIGAAKLCASWMMAGFVHGVLNSDNMNVTGESFDYGPYRFLPTYDPKFTAAYFDESGLYAYGNQPESVVWNLERLAECLLLIADEDSLIEALQNFAQVFNDSAGSKFRERLGLEDRGTPGDERLTLAGVQLLAASQVHFEQFFHDWFGGSLSRERALRSPEASLYVGPAYENFLDTIRDWPAAPGVGDKLEDPYFARAKPCMLLIDEIEAIWAPIAEKDDWSLFEKKIDDIRLMGRVHGRR
ncbi:MAG: YdiU family protein [Bdellovibrionota bacterium]